MHWSWALWHRYASCRTGRAYASVFPLPVGEQMRRSKCRFLPPPSAAKVFCWIGSSFLIPRRPSRASTSSGQSPEPANDPALMAAALLRTSPGWPGWLGGGTKSPNEPFFDATPIFRRRAKSNAPRTRSSRGGSVT